VRFRYATNSAPLLRLLRQ